jgi:hypothetical protein
MTDQAAGHKAIEQWVSVKKGNEKGRRSHSARDHQSVSTAAFDLSH